MDELESNPWDAMNDEGDGDDDLYSPSLHPDDDSDFEPDEAEDEDDYEFETFTTGDESDSDNPVNSLLNCEPSRHFPI
jgi:hypothetical protein